MSAEIPSVFLAFRDPPKNAATPAPPPPPTPSPSPRADVELTPEIVHLPERSPERRRSFTFLPSDDLFGRPEETAAVDVDTLLPTERALSPADDARPRLHEETLTGINVRPLLQIETDAPRPRLVIARPHTLPPPTANFPSPLRAPLPPPPVEPVESPFAQPSPMERTAVFEMPPPVDFSPPTLPVLPMPLAPVVTPPPPPSRISATSDRDAARVPVIVWWILGVATVGFLVMALILAAR